MTHDESEVSRHSYVIAMLFSSLLVSRPLSSGSSELYKDCSRGSHEPSDGDDVARI